jgi:hypothetical protein
MVSVLFLVVEGHLSLPMLLLLAAVVVRTLESAVEVLEDFSLAVLS